MCSNLNFLPKHSEIEMGMAGQFLSYAFQILQKCITFEDAEMILLALLKILSLNRIFKKSIQLLVHTGAVLASIYFMQSYKSSKLDPNQLDSGLIHSDVQ